MLYQPTLVSKDFYEVVKKTTPKALSEPRFARLLDYLLFSDFRDEDTGYRVCPESLLADMEDSSHKLQGKTRNYNRAVIFPQEFQEVTGLSLLSLPYHFKDGRASAYELSSLPEPLQEALIVELLNPVTDKYKGVYLEKGKPLSIQKEQEYKHRFLKHKLEYMAKEIPRPDVRYLNESSRTSTFLDRKIETRLAFALSAAQQIPNLDKRAFAIRNLIKLPTFEPLYQAKGNTQRIYAAGVSLQNFSAAMRTAILQPSKNYDLAAAQLAIMATHWEVSEIQSLIQRGEVWENICRSLGISEDRKSVAKQLIYSTAFGMTETNLAIRYGQGLGELPLDSTAFNTPAEIIENYSERIWGNKYLSALLNGRKRAMQRIQDSKEAVDAQGEVFRSFDFDTSWEGGRKLRTMIAFEMQSREKWLMEPVIDLAQENEGKMLITLWLHDGVYIHYPKSDRYQKIEREMVRRVNNRANDAGYPTTLELVTKRA